MLSYGEPNLKNSFEKVVFQILAKIEMTQNKNRLFGRHFERVEHFKYCLQNYDFYSAYIGLYGANLIAKFCWKSAGFPQLGP